MPRNNLEPGLTHEARHLVTREMSPPHIEGILATFRMIGLIEDTCLAAVQPLFDVGVTTVGTRVDVTHVGTARTGEEITVRVCLAKVTRGRLLSFTVTVDGPAGVIGTGTHQRLVVEWANLTRA